MTNNDTLAIPPDSAIREIVTPEGVPLRVTLGSRGERLTAVLIDLVIIGATLVAMVVGLIMLLPQIGPGWAYSIGIILSFGVRSFYFIFFELRWQGTTPGKRLMNLRVIDRAGGRLRPNAIFARNLMREVELFVPLSLLLTGGGGLTTLLTLMWMGALMALPFFNRDRLRAGDIAGGTWVVETPKTELLPDIAEVPPEGEAPAAIRFTEAQLGFYGIYELQTLEDVLRQSVANAAATRESVARAIRQKIGWEPADGQPVDDEAFLRAFYAAQRSHLERKALFGRRRANKFDTD